jgi:hypothetical protein
LIPYVPMPFEFLPNRSSFYRPGPSKNPNKNRTKSALGETFLRVATR